MTHDQEEALGLASRIAVMNHGRLVQIGPPAEIYQRPASRFVAGFVGAVNLFEGTLIAGFNALGLALGDAEAPAPLPQPLALPAGSALALAVRPEKLLLSRDRPAGFALAATVVSIGYQGGQSTVHLVSASGQALRADLPSGAALTFTRGDALWANWQPQDSVALVE